MRYFWLLILAGALGAQPADLVILVETSQLTCGKPIEVSRQALRSLCGMQQGKVAVGTFARLRRGRAITWLTTPVQPLNESGTCAEVFDRIRSRCDSIFQVNLLHAVEEAITQGYGQHILVLASGKESGRGLTAGEVRHLAKKKGVSLYFVSIGWLLSDEATQAFFKQLAGILEGEEGTLAIIDPTASDAADKLQAFISAVWKKVEPPVAEIPVAPVPVPADPPKQEKPSSDWLWIALAGGGVILVLIAIFSFLRSKDSKAASVPSAPVSPTPASSPPPLPTLSRFIVYYPHGQQEVRLSPSSASIALGRAPDNTIVITDATVSSHHARLFLQGNQWYVQDLGSTNGTFVNEQRVSQHPIRIGDRLRLGAIVVQIAG